MTILVLKWLLGHNDYKNTKKILVYKILPYTYLGLIHSTLNAPIHAECKTLKHVVSSAAKAETGGVYSNCTFAIPIRNMLKALGHPQGPTAIKTDNQTAASFIHNT